MMDDTTFNLAPPPRNVPLSLRVKVLFGGFFSQFGWMLFGIGMMFVWIFGANSDITFWRFWGELETANGVVVSREDTGASVGGSEHSRSSPIYRCAYKFGGPDGTERESASFSTGGYHEGATVVVEFPAGNPDVSRIRGMRSSIFPVWTLFVVVFPLVGSCFMFFGWRRGRKANRLLTHGQPALATLVEKQPTHTRINDRMVYKLTFEFDAGASEKHRMVAKSHLPEHVEDEESERLLYDPRTPSYAVLLDNLPAASRVDEMGEFRPTSTLGAALSLLVPLATLLGHGGWVVFAYLT